MINKKEKQSHEELIKLIQENPNLPVVPMVNTEIVCGDDCRYYLGEWGSVSVDEYCLSEERVYFRSDDDIEEPLTDILGWDAYEKMSDEEANKAYAELPWVKAIVVYIEYV